MKNNIEKERWEQIVRAQEEINSTMFEHHMHEISNIFSSIYLKGLTDGIKLGKQTIITKEDTDYEIKL